MATLLRGALGLLVFIVLAWLISEKRGRVRWRMVALGLALQLGLGVLLLKLVAFKGVFLALNRAVLFLQESTLAGTGFVFGYLGGAAPPFDVTAPENTFILGIQALPLVLLMSALSALMFHWRILPLIVRGFSRVLQRTLGLGGAEGVGVSVNIFLGMVESPLFVRPYLSAMTRAEIFSLMTCGMATIAGTVMVLYAGILQSAIPDVMGHILTASIISAPAAVTVARIMVPETAAPTAGELINPEPSAGAMDAITRGTLQGVQLLINIIAMLVVLVAIVHLINLTLGLLPFAGGGRITLEGMLGTLMAPVAWLMGVPWAEAHVAGSLMGTKTVLNEFIAYLQMAGLPEGTLSPKSMLIMTYALCGFANPGSLGIMIGGMGTMAPDRRDEIVALGPRSIVAGTLAACMTGAIVGMLL